jgi:hypothetical protein
MMIKGMYVYEQLWDLCGEIWGLKIALLKRLSYPRWYLIYQMETSSQYLWSYLNRP